MIKHSVSRNRSENHIEVTISIGEHEDVKEIKKAIQKTLRRYRRLLNGNLSFEYQIIDKSKGKLIDQTIESICEFVKKELSREVGMYENVPDTIKALAELIATRAKLSEK